MIAHVKIKYKYSFESKKKKMLKKNGEYISKNGIIIEFMEDICYEGSNFWRNHASFKDTRKLAYYAKRWF